jgi:alkyl hydroperoxide reductase subunit AhpC
MNQSENVAFSMSPELIIFFAKVQGAGAATAPVRAPTTFSNTSWKGFMFASNNFVSTVATDIATSATGVYTAKLRDVTGHVINISADLAGTDGKWAQVTNYNHSTQVISFQVFSALGALADMASTDFVTFTIFGQKVKPTY